VRALYRLGGGHVMKTGHHVTAAIQAAVEAAADEDDFDREVCVQFNNFVRASDNSASELKFTALDEENVVNVVYMLHNPLTCSPMENAQGGMAYTMTQLMKVWSAFGLDASALGICITELNPLTGEPGLVESRRPLYDTICAETMTAALMLAPSKLVVFGRFGRERWLSEWRSLEVVQDGEVMYNEHGRPMLHILLHSGAKVAVFFSTHPSAWAAIENVMVTLAAVHRAHIKMSDEEILQVVQSVTATTAVKINDVRQSVVQNKAYPYVAITVEEGGRFVLADGVLTHKSTIDTDDRSRLYMSASQLLILSCFSVVAVFSLFSCRH
jgi:hypothetical protein